jgi:predicted lipoprotein
MKSDRRSTRKRVRRNEPSLPPQSNTMEGIQRWYAIEFKKLGWMVLAKAKNQTYKIDTYKRSIADLIQSTKHVMNEYANSDRKHDLNVLLMNLKQLQLFVNKNL